MKTQTELSERDIKNYSKWIVKYCNNPEFEIEYLVELILNNNEESKRNFIEIVKNNF